MLGERGSILDLLSRALLRGALVGAALVVPGLAAHAAFFGLTLASALGEAAFDLALGLFVIAPSALLEGLGRDRDPPALAPVVAVGLTLPVAAVGAAGAFLQSIYASAVLRSGSFEEGLAEVTRGAQGLALLESLQGLFVAIALVMTAVSASRWRARVGSRFGVGEWSLTLAACVVLLRVTGLHGAAFGVSGSMLAALALAAPPLADVADAIAARVRARREG